MKQYIGTKQIQAKPMTRQQYNDLRGWSVPENENPNDDGYLIIYPDSPDRNVDGFNGYVSWSPKMVFEKVYRENDCPMQRVQIEYDQLQEKLSKLKTFLAYNKPDFISQKQWELMQQQQKIMGDYVFILYQRLNDNTA